MPPPHHRVWMPAISRPSPPQRALSLLLVALLHALLLFAVLHFMVAKQHTVTAAPEKLLEMIINTARKPVPVSAPAPSGPTKAVPRYGGVFKGVVPFTVPPVAPPDVTGLGQALFGCAPENPTLTTEQRAHCMKALGGGFTRPDDDALIEPKSHVKDLARREAEMRAKNTPGRVPCTHLTEVQTSLAGNSTVPVVDPACAIGGLVNGFGPLNGLDK
jgi:hypothetical protein